jgi:hypothetical protein
MSVDAYQAAVALIAKDTLSLSNSKLMLIAVAGELNSRAGSPEQRAIECLLDPLAFALRRPLRLLLAKFVSDSRPR